jgi:hypothetical protein
MSDFNILPWNQSISPTFDIEKASFLSVIFLESFLITRNIAGMQQNYQLINEIAAHNGPIRYV